MHGVHDAEAHAAVLEAGGVAAACAALKRQAQSPSSSHMQRWCCAVLGSLSEGTEGGAQAVVKNGGAHAIVQAARAGLLDVAMLQQGLISCLAIATRGEAARAALASGGALELALAGREAKQRMGEELLTLLVQGSQARKDAALAAGAEPSWLDAVDLSA